MNYHESLIQRLLGELIAAGNSQTRIAEMTKIDQSIISRIVSGAIADPGASKLAAVIRVHNELIREKRTA